MGWLAGRLLQALATAVAALLAFFVIMRAAPGDPLAALIEDRVVSAAQLADLRRRYGVDQPIADQLAAFLPAALRGDLGVSFVHGRPVRDMVRERLPATALLGGLVLALNFTLGLWLGVRQAVARGRWTDRALGALSLAGYAMPSFWLGLLLAGWFGVTLRWLPVAGMRDPLLAGAGAWAQAFDIARHAVLPTVTLAAVSIAATMRYQRAAMLEALAEPFVLAARARGLPDARVRWRHAWRNALFPILTLFGLWLPILVAGSVFVEQVFAWPGLGSLAAEAATARDYPLLLGTAALATLAVVLGGVVTDVAHRLLDPRLRDA